jgi:hypothetical protein
MRAVLFLTLMLSACGTGALTGRLQDSAARSVVVNVLINQYPKPEAEQATECLLRNASAEERDALARDVGARAGTTTVARIAAIAARPATAQCVAGRGLAPLRL